MNKQKLILSTAFALAAASIALPIAQAAEHGPRLTKQVTYIDLDLTRTAGAVTFYRRIGSAAEQVCAPQAGRSTREFRQWRNCIDETIARAVVEMNNHVLTTYHLARQGKRTTTTVAAR